MTYRNEDKDEKRIYSCGNDGCNADTNHIACRICTVHDKEKKC